MLRERDNTTHKEEPPAQQPRDDSGNERPSPAGLLPKRWVPELGLTAREESLLARWLGLDSAHRETLREIGSDIGMSPAGVNKIVRHAIVKLALIHRNPRAPD